MRAAARIAAETLAPHAARRRRPRPAASTRAHLAELVRHRLLSITIPAAEGGHGADVRVDAEVVEQLSGGCGATWFVTTQHRFPQALSRGPLTGLRPDAIANSARPRPGTAPAWPPRTRWPASPSRTSAGPARPRCAPSRPAPAGPLHGAADWCTGWGLIDVVMIAASTPDERVRARPAAGPGAARAARHRRRCRCR